MTYLTPEATDYVFTLAAWATLIEAHPDIKLPAGCTPAQAALFARDCLDAAFGQPVAS